MRGFDAPLLRVTTMYVVVALVMTWPLAAGLARDVPGDLGDSLLNMWILGWGAEHVPRVLGGQMAVGEFWNANIFHPEPLALAFSEHLFGQVLQILPIYWLTGNLILAYNLLFLSSFVLSGVGMYLLAREWLDGGRSSICWPALVAGLIYAFVPYRIAQVAHIQVLSSHWMPFALYGFVRFIRGTDEARRTRGLRPWAPLAGGTAALLMQNWSCGYYLIYFAPCVVIVVIHQIFVSGHARGWRLWTAFAVAGAIVAAGTWPFLGLYLSAQQIHGFERPFGEILFFSADLYSYVTPPQALQVWGPLLRGYPKLEGELFFGAVPWALTAIALFDLVGRRAGGDAAATARAGPVTKVLSLILVVQVAGLVGLLLTGGFVSSFAGIPIRATNAQRLLTSMLLVVVVLLAVSPAARRRARAAAATPLVLALVLTALAMWLSLGPQPHSMGQPLRGLGLYGLLYDRVPGFDGLRVPARYAMIAALFMAIAAAFGITAFTRRRTGVRPIAVVVSALFLVEVAFLPMTLNATWGDGAVSPPPRVHPAASAPAVYRHLAQLDGDVVVTEFPFGDKAWELRYVYYSTVHWKRLVNGFSGWSPLNYERRAALLNRFTEQADAAWQALVDAGTTHVIVHETAMPAEHARSLTTWLEARGARLLQRFDADVLYALPPTAPQ